MSRWGVVKEQLKELNGQALGGGPTD